MRGDSGLWSSAHAGPLFLKLFSLEHTQNSVPVIRLSYPSRIHHHIIGSRQHPHHQCLQRFKQLQINLSPYAPCLISQILNFPCWHLGCESDFRFTQVLLWCLWIFYCESCFGVNTVTSQQEGSCFEAQLEPFCVELACSPCVCVGLSPGTPAFSHCPKTCLLG